MKSNIEIRKIGVTRLDADCVVNAANSALREGGGVCGAIFRDAGRDELTRACNKIGHCDTGSAVITPGFGLKARYIVHAVGPVWNGGNHGEREALYNCYQASLRLAIENGCHSIGFPLISSGIFGYPKDKAWEVALTSVRDFLLNHSGADISVIFAVLEDSDKALGEAKLKDLVSACNFIKVMPHAEVGEAKEQKAEIQSGQQDNIFFFWKECDRNGWLSQWYEAPFIIEGIQYRFCEQYMMAKKALLFEDMKYYFAIMSARSPEECKKLGKLVRNYNDKLWVYCREEIVFHANMAKFCQNRDLKFALLSTGNHLLAEASPYDAIWGIGLKESDPAARDQSKWGENLLGNILMKVREELRKEN